MCGSSLGRVQRHGGIRVVASWPALYSGLFALALVVAALGLCWVLYRRYTHPRVAPPAAAAKPDVGRAKRLGKLSKTFGSIGTAAHRQGRPAGFASVVASPGRVAPNRGTTFLGSASAGSAVDGRYVQERISQASLPPRSTLRVASPSDLSFKMRAVSLARLGHEVEEHDVGKRHNSVDVASSSADRHTRLDLAEKGESQRRLAPAAEELDAVIDAGSMRASPG